MLSRDWPNESTARAMTVDDLAIAILFEIASAPAPSQMRNRGGFLNHVVDDAQEGWCPGGQIVTMQSYVGGFEKQNYRNELKQMVGEAWDLLRYEGLLAPDPTQRGTDFTVLTNRGRDVIARGRPQALAWARAVAALNHPLHPRLQAVGVDATFRAGRLDTSIRDAFRDVEHCVREISGLSVASPVPLMEQAFAIEKGPLADHSASKPSQHALQRLFMALSAATATPRTTPTFRTTRARQSRSSSSPVCSFANSTRSAAASA